ncbi:MAG: hypothetical protein ACE37F_37795 [Nannocystaceae bacterium]|nr:protein N-terminal glutamine amidohydrolase [bacterium]
MTAPRYCPFYCEENVWHLANDPQVGQGPRHVLLISNAARQVALWQQRAGAAENGGLVVWDYHVVLTCAAKVWDLDSRLAQGVVLAEYLAQTFRGAPERFAPAFRVMPAEVYRDALASDRRHMRAEDGAYRQPPPPWPAIGQGHTLDALLDFERGEPGVVVDLPGLVAYLPGR